jgi:hypothetical protein
MTAEDVPKGPPFTVERYGSFGQSVIAERDWLLEEVERLKEEIVIHTTMIARQRTALIAAETALGLHPDVGDKHGG